MKRDYDLVLTPVMEEELTKMGSLALGIAERAKTEGEKNGENRVMEAIRMLKPELFISHDNQTKTTQFLQV